MVEYKLDQLVIKPTLACTSNCPTCASRKDLHKELVKSKKISFEQWEKILRDAATLGVKRLDISGGEPTLYKHLNSLIKIGKEYGWHVNLNSNGSLITQKFAEKLLDSGLDSIGISLYSPYPEIHDELRRHPGLWEKATNAIRIFAELKKNYPNFTVQTQALLIKENYRSLPELIELHYNLGSEKMAFTYVEGDFEKKFLLNEEEIYDFKENVVPKAIDYCQTLPPSVRNKAMETLKNCFSEEVTSVVNFSRGIYRPKDSKNMPCQRPKHFALILANGDVHPCNMVEYSHDPIMGNTFEKSLIEIWHSDKWNKFRNELFDYCELCPINLYMTIPLKPHLKESFLKKICFGHIWTSLRHLTGIFFNKKENSKG